LIIIEPSSLIRSGNSLEFAAGWLMRPPPPILKLLDHQKHPNKPLMLAEFGTARTGQPKWLLRAFRTIKTYSGIKAAIYWDNVNIRYNSDHILSEEGIKQLKEILKDPYFI
jgi:hypothetical protein